MYATTVLTVPLSKLIFEVGFAFGVVSAVANIAARLPQIKLNFTRRSCRGVSLVMFSLLLAADSTYLMAIVLESTGWPYIAKKVPWLVLSVGCGMLDSVIIWQYFHYGAGSDNQSCTGC